MRQENPEIKAFFNDCLQPIYTYKLLFEDLEFLNKSLEKIDRALKKPDLDPDLINRLSEKAQLLSQQKNSVLSMICRETESLALLNRQLRVLNNVFNSLGLTITEQAFITGLKSLGLPKSTPDYKQAPEVEYKLVSPLRALSLATTQNLQQSSTSGSHQDQMQQIHPR